MPLSVTLFKIYISEFEDTTKQKIPAPGSFPLLGSRRGDYSSSPPTRGDSSNYSRGIYGKWGSRSSGQSDKDSDSQSDKDSGWFCAVVYFSRYFN